jgi:hypothetical protein
MKLLQISEQRLSTRQLRGNLCNSGFSIHIRIKQGTFADTFYIQISNTLTK